MRFPRFHFGVAIALGLSMLCMSSVPVFADGPMLRDVDDCTDLQDMSNFLAAVYTLTADIDCDGVEFTPVGTGIAPFTGTLNGSGFTISNLTVDTSSSSAGLFGYTDGAVIHDVTIDSANIHGDAGMSAGVGGIVGYADATDFLNVAVTNSVITNSGSDTGGIAGNLYGAGAMTGAYVSNTTITGEELVVGGLVGSLQHSSIADGYVNADIEGGGFYTGGIAGSMIAATAAPSRIENVYATGSVVGNQDTGGIVGEIYSGTINPVSCVFRNVFAGNSVSGASNVGALVGEISDTDCAVENSFFLNHAGNPDDCVFDDGGSAVACTEKTVPAYFTDSDNEPLASWDFADVWYVASTHLPFLRWADINPLPPTSLSISVTGSSALLSWTNPTDADFKSITILGSTTAYLTDPGLGGAAVQGLVAESWTLNNLSEGAHYFSVIAFDTLDNFSAAATGSVIIDTTPPAAPSLSASANGNTITLSWNEPATTNSFTIRRSPVSAPASVSDGTLVATVGSGTTSYVDTTLANGTYYYSIFALDTADNVSDGGQANATVSVSSSSSSSGNTDTSSSGEGGGGGRRGGPGRGGTAPTIDSAARRQVQPAATRGVATTKPLLEIRICERVMRWFRGNKKMLDRVNGRLENRFGFTCEE